MRTVLWLCRPLKTGPWVQVSLHVELRQAFSHQSGRPQPADGPVHLHSSMREFLMQEVANKVVAAEEEGGREGGEEERRRMINWTVSTEASKILHQKNGFKNWDGNSENVCPSCFANYWNRTPRCGEKLTYKIVPFKSLHRRQGFFQLFVRALQAVNWGGKQRIISKKSQVSSLHLHQCDWPNELTLLSVKRKFLPWSPWHTQLT